jgi:hypothetical protein
VRAMFGLFGKKKDLLSTITFDEAYCHSARLEKPLTYRIPKGTTELRFVFPDFNGFWQTYINRNPHLPDETITALQEDRALFSTAVIVGGNYRHSDGPGEDNDYRHFDGVGEDGSILLNADTLHAFGHDKPFTTFSKGGIAFGIYHTGIYRFDSLWSTVYEAA